MSECFCFSFPFALLYPFHHFNIDLLRTWSVCCTNAREHCIVRLASETDTFYAFVPEDIQMDSLILCVCVCRFISRFSQLFFSRFKRLTFVMLQRKWILSSFQFGWRSQFGFFIQAYFHRVCALTNFLHLNLFDNSFSVRWFFFLCVLNVVRKS